MRDELFSIFDRMKGAAADRGDENTIAVIHRAEHMFAALPAYLHPTGVRTTSPLLEGTSVPLAVARQPTSDTSAVVHTRRREQENQQALDDLSVLDNPTPEQVEQRATLKARMGRPTWTRDDEKQEPADADQEPKLAAWTPPPPPAFGAKPAHLGA